MSSKSFLLPILALSLNGCVVFELTSIRQSFPPLEGEFTVSELTDTVDIVRDDLGVPHIRATTAADAWRGLGFVHGQDRYYSADLFRRLAFGRISEWWCSRFATAVNAVSRKGSLPASRLSRHTVHPWT